VRDRDSGNSPDYPSLCACSVCDHDAGNSPDYPWLCVCACSVRDHDAGNSPDYPPLCVCACSVRDHDAGNSPGRRRRRRVGKSGDVDSSLSSSAAMNRGASNGVNTSSDKENVDLPDDSSGSVIDNQASTPCLKKTVHNCFCHKFVKCLPNLIIFGTQIAQGIGLCEVHSFSTSPN